MFYWRFQLAYHVQWPRRRSNLHRRVLQITTNLLFWYETSSKHRETHAHDNTETKSGKIQRDNTLRRRKINNNPEVADQDVRVAP